MWRFIYAYWVVIGKCFGVWKERIIHDRMHLGCVDSKLYYQHLYLYAGLPLVSTFKIR